MKVVLHNYMTRNIGSFRATGGTRDHRDCGCGCGGKGDCNHGQDTSPIEQAKQNYLRQSDLLTKVNKEVRELTANRTKTKADVNAVYNRYDKVKADFEAAKQELDHLERSERRVRDEYSKAELGIDVTYAKGGYGRPKILETRHYTVPNIMVDPRGYAPSGAFVAAELRKQPGHTSMVKSGWTAEKAEGYYKREQRDVGKMV
jgi:hypothetical protein